jgi:hypothetical protein
MVLIHQYRELLLPVDWQGACADRHKAMSVGAGLNT